MLWDKKESNKAGTLDEKNQLLRMSEISLILDTYDDIFSDFDPRPYHVRQLSDDFLQELKRAARDKPSGSIEIKFMMPHHSRNLISENLIKKRLREHFKKHHQETVNEVKKIRRNGVLMSVFGVLMIMLAGWLLSIPDSELWIKFLIVLLEPAGWFTAWTGLEHMWYAIEDKEIDYKFYEKMSQADINFLPY